MDGKLIINRKGEMMAERKKTVTAKPAEEKAIERFTKEQLLTSKRFIDNRDVLNVLLDGSKLYSIDEAESIISVFMEGKVK